MITTVKDAVRRTRQHHAIEHATLHLLASRLPGRRMAGYSDAGGFTIFGDVPLDQVRRAVSDAMLHLQAGESSLAIHPNCGTNLQMQKTGTVCTAVGGMADCRFTVIVHNTGPGNYSGSVTLTDSVPTGTSAYFEDAPPWICGGGPPTYTCTLPNVNLPPGGVLHLVMHVRMPLAEAAHVQGCHVPNEARITFPAGGSAQ